MTKYACQKQLNFTMTCYGRQKATYSTVHSTSSEKQQRRRGMAHFLPCPSSHPNVKKVVCTRLPSVGFRSWSRFLGVSLQVTWVINPAVGCQYFPPGQQLPPQPLRGLLPISLLGEHRRDGCEQFAYDCYSTASRLRFEPRPYCAWVQQANQSATEPPHTTNMCVQKARTGWSWLPCKTKIAPSFRRRRLQQY